MISCHSSSSSTFQLLRAIQAPCHLQRSRAIIANCIMTRRVHLMRLASVAATPSLRATMKHKANGTRTTMSYTIFGIYISTLTAMRRFPLFLSAWLPLRTQDLLKRKRDHSSTTPPPLGRRRAPAPTTHNTPLPAESALPPPPSNVTPPSLTTLPDEVQLLICDDLRGRDPCSAPNL